MQLQLSGFGGPALFTIAPSGAARAAPPRIRFRSDDTGRRSGLRLSWELARAACETDGHCSFRGQCVRGACVCAADAYGLACGSSRCLAFNQPNGATQVAGAAGGASGAFDASPAPASSCRWLMDGAAGGPRLDAPGGGEGGGEAPWEGWVWSGWEGGPLASNESTAPSKVAAPPTPSPPQSPPLGSLSGSQPLAVGVRISWSRFALGPVGRRLDDAEQDAATFAHASLEWADHLQVLDAQGEVRLALASERCRAASECQRRWQVHEIATAWLPPPPAAPSCAGPLYIYMYIYTCAISSVVECGLMSNGFVFKQFCLID